MSEPPVTRPSTQSIASATSSNSCSPDGLLSNTNNQLESRRVSLSGYLNKLSGSGPLRGFKRRWFVFSESNCKLYYYRARDDLLPLGEIDIRRATFKISPPNKNDSVFTIISFDKEYTFEAPDRKQCLFWLQELQKLRRAYITKLADKFGVKLANFDDGQNRSSSMTDSQSMTDSVATSNSVFYCDSFEDPQKCVNASDAHPIKVNREELIVLATHSPATKHRIFSGMLNKIKKPDSMNAHTSLLQGRHDIFKRGERSRSLSRCTKCKVCALSIVNISSWRSSLLPYS